MRQDVIIVGAPRSGTNMLRDVLIRRPEVSTWPCDEINLVWRYGNRDYPSDEFTADMATPEISRYVHRRFDRIARKYGCDVVVEKTCATSLRVEFTRELFPDAKYVFITRDGVDCAASAIERWHAPLDVPYIAAKSRFVPLSDVTFYGLRFLGSQMKRGRPTAGSVLTWWGPKPDNFRELMDGHPLDEICMIQWQRCVELSQRALTQLPDDQLLRISYEEFVETPEAHLHKLLEFLGLPHQGDLQSVVADISRDSVGKGRAKLGEERVARLEALAAQTLQGLGYA